MNEHETGRFIDRKSDTPSNGSAKEIVVFSVTRDSQCTDCGAELGKGHLLRLEGEKALCMGCADLDRLEFLPAGDAAVTRRASKYSTLRAVVVRWSRTRKRYERQGILVEPEAIHRAEHESLADAEVRARRQERAAERRALEDQEFIAAFASAIRAHYPGCPATEETEIAEHACRKYSGRVGRTAAAKELSPEAIRRAVIAHIRHVHTNYDELLARYADRDAARDSIRGEVSAILDDWQQPGVASGAVLDAPGELRFAGGRFAGSSPVEETPRAESHDLSRVDPRADPGLGRGAPRRHGRLAGPRLRSDPGRSQ